jgi:hypothetical protein
MLAATVWFFYVEGGGTQTIVLLGWALVSAVSSSLSVLDWRHGYRTFDYKFIFQTKVLTHEKLFFFQMT